MPALYLATGHVAGEQCSSTYEGRHLTLEEGHLTHPVHGDGLVDHGDPVIVGALQSPMGEIVGVAFTSAAAATDLIAIDTEGIWFLSGVAVDDNGNSAIAPGDMIYINRTTAVLSKVSSPVTNIPFGRSLGDVATGTTAVVAIKVHCDPPSEIGEIVQSWVKTGMVDDAGTSGRIDLTVLLPAGAIPLGWKAVTTVAFSGDTTAVISVGIAGDTTRFTADATQSCFTVGTVGSAPLAASAFDGIGAAQAIRVTITGTADFTNINVLGAMTMHVYYIAT